MQETSDHKLLVRRLLSKRPKRFLVLLAAVVLAGERYDESIDALG